MLKLFAVAMLVLGTTSCMTFNIGRPNQGLRVQPHRIADGAKEHIGIISLTGVITDQENRDFWGGKGNMLERHAIVLQHLEKEKNLKALIVKINSPGGEVTTSDIMYRELAEFKKRKKIPVIAVFFDVAASGGYYVAMAADKIIAHPTAITGSIGVIQFMFSAEELLSKKLGLRDESVMSGKNKDLGSPFKTLAPEQRAIFQGLIDDMYGQFVKVVQNGRPNLTKDAILTLADGRIYTASQALTNGLIDKIGYMDEALAEATSMASLQNPSVVMYDFNGTTSKSYYANPESVALPTQYEALAKAVTGRENVPAFYYLAPLAQISF